MNEEQAVLDFFAQTENLPLGLAVAEQMDELRRQINNQFWRDLQSRLDSLINEHELTWQLRLTEDRNAPDSLVGLHLTPRADQAIYLTPMVEQQYLGGEWRIYFGLRWNVPAAPDLLASTPVHSLKLSMLKAGFKTNESFLAWQWTAFHPRRKDFLLRYSLQPGQLLDELEAILKTLLLVHGPAITQANAALLSAPPSLAVALDQLRSELTG